MNRKNFGKLIVALRREYLESRGKPPTRQKFVEELEIDEDTLSNIENGRRAILYPDLLIKIANALKLTSGERREFFLAASGVDEQDIYSQQQDTPQAALDSILTMMDKIRQPAVLVDQFFDIVAINQIAMEIYNINMSSFSDPNANAATRVNLIRFLFSSEFNQQKKMLATVWDQFAMGMIVLFRASSLRYRATEYFQNLYPHLLEFDDFKAYILRKPMDDLHMDNNMFINLENPRFGTIQSISTSLTTSSTDGKLKLITLTPLSEETANIFANLSLQGNYVFQTLHKWPDKSELAEK